MSRLSNAAVAGIIVAIVSISAVVCVVLLCIIIRLWSKWREVSVSNSDGEECKEKQERRGGGGGDRFESYWKVGSTCMVTSSEKQSSTSETSILQQKMEVGGLDDSGS